MLQQMENIETNREHIGTKWVKKLLNNFVPSPYKRNTSYFFTPLCNSSKYPPNIHLFKVKNGNIRTKCKICSKLTIKTPVK